MAAKKAKKAIESGKTISENRKARRSYEILDTFDAGMVLQGTEVKTLRGGQVSIEEAYAKLEEGEVWLIGAHIEEYTFGNRQNHKPDRPRKLLLHKREIVRIQAKTEQKGLTLVPLRMYFSDRGFAKITLGLGRGRSKGDSRQHERSKHDAREMRDY